MKIALLVAILLIAISVPTAYAATLQLVTENGNVFSIDFDEIWNIYSGYNSTATNTELNSTAVNQEIQRLISATTTNSTTQQEIKEMEDRLENLFEQLNSNSTSTATTINELQNQINTLLADTSTDDEINRLQNLIANLTQSTNSTATELNEALTELETLLEDSVEELEAGTGVGAGALGSSGRLVSIPTEGIMALGVHTVRDTRGTVEPTTAYFYTDYDFDWVTLIRENEAYDEYAVPSLNAEYNANQGAGTLRETSTTLTSELNVRGLEPYTTWALLPTGTDAITYAGVTNSAGDMLIPRTPNDGVTITRTTSFNNSPDLNIPDRGSIRDTITVNKHGTVNDLHVTITSYGSSYRAQLISPDGTNYQVNTSGGHGSRTYSINAAVGEQINGDWTLIYKSMSGTTRTLQDWTLVINHGTTGKIQSISGSGSQYTVSVGQARSGLFGLDLVNAHGIVDSRNNLLDNSLQTGPDEIHNAGGGGVGPDTSDPLHVYSIERHDPLSILSADRYPQFLVTFNKRVENVDVADFVGGYGSTSQVTRTITTPLDVWYGESSVTVPQSGTRTASNTKSFPLDAAHPTVTSNIAHTNYRLSSKEVASVSVTVSIGHDDGRDLKIELVAPDGTREIIQDRGVGHLPPSGKTFTNSNTAALDSFTGVSARGTWSLVVTDMYPRLDHGDLNGWSLTLGYGDSTVTYVEHAPESSTTRISLSSSKIVTNATLTLNAVSADSNVNEWELSLTTPGGIDIELADAASTHLDNKGGVHTFHLGEIVGVFPGSGTWRLNAVDLKTDHDPTNPNTDEPEGTIDSWTLDLDTLSKRSVREVLPHGSDGTKYLVKVNAYRNGNVLFLKGDTDISARNSGETYDTRNTVFAPDPHELYNRGSVSIPSTPHVRGITVSSSTSSSVTFQVLFSETVTGVNATDFIVIENKSPESSGPQESTYSSAPNTSVNSNSITTVSDTIPIRGYADGAVNVLTLNVDISHTRIGDLEVELVGPDGTKRKVHNNAGGTTADLMTSFTPNFADKSVNGNWTLQVRDDRSTQSFGTINSWSLDFSYEDTPTYDELLVVETQKGAAYTWKEFLSGNYNLRTYSDAPVHHTPCATNGIMMDGYNGGTACIDNDNINTLVYTSGAYMKYPVTVDVSISNIRMTGPGKSDVSMRYIDGSYKAGNSFYIPIIPGMTTLKMNIAGSEASVDLADIAPAVSIISLEPATDKSYVVGTRRAVANAVTTVPFFAGEDKTYYVIINYEVTGSMSYSIQSERTKGWMLSSYSYSIFSGGHVDLGRGSYHAYTLRTNSLEGGLKSVFGPAVSSAANYASNGYLSTYLGVFRNGVLIDQYPLASKSMTTTSNSHTVSSSASIATVQHDGRRTTTTSYDIDSSTASFRSSQSGSAMVAPITIEKTIKINAEIGDFVEMVFINRVSGSNLATPSQYVPSLSYSGTIPCNNNTTCNWSYTLKSLCRSSPTINWCTNHNNSDVYGGYTESKIINGYVLVI